MEIDKKYTDAVQVILDAGDDGFLVLIPMVDAHGKDVIVLGIEPPPAVTGMTGSSARVVAPVAIILGDEDAKKLTAPGALQVGWLDLKGLKSGNPLEN